MRHPSQESTVGDEGPVPALARDGAGEVTLGERVLQFFDQQFGPLARCSIPEIHPGLRIIDRPVEGRARLDAAQCSALLDALRSEDIAAVSHDDGKEVLLLVPRDDLKRSRELVSKAEASGSLPVLEH